MSNSFTKQIQKIIDHFQSLTSPKKDSYTSEVFRNVRWHWKYESTDPSDEIIDLSPCCPNCEDAVATYSDYDSLVIFCQKCDCVLDTVVATEAGYRSAVKSLIAEQVEKRFGITQPS